MLSPTKEMPLVVAGFNTMPNCAIITERETGIVRTANPEAFKAFGFGLIGQVFETREEDGTAYGLCGVKYWTQTTSQFSLDGTVYVSRILASVDQNVWRDRPAT